MAAGGPDGAAAQPTYIEALLVCDFDVDIGQKTSFCWPPGSLTATEQRRVAQLALPDSSVHGSGDLLYTFRLRRDTLPLFAASALTHDYAFGASLFRQRRDPAVKRGVAQRSVVLISRTPYVNLLKAVVRLVGSRFFDAEARAVQAAPPASGGALASSPPLLAPAADVLRAAHTEISSWPAARAGATVRLRLFGCALDFDVPYTSVRGYAPVLARGGGIAHTADGVAPLSAQHGGAEVLHSSTPGSARSADGAGPFFPDADSGAGADGSSGDGGSSRSGSHTNAEAVAGRNRETPDSASGRRPSSSAAAGPSGQQRQSRRAMGIRETLARKRHQTPGLFQEVGLFSVFRGLCAHLWHLWELVITGALPVICLVVWRVAACVIAGATCVIIYFQRVALIISNSTSVSVYLPACIYFHLYWRFRICRLQGNPSC